MEQQSKVPFSGDKHEAAGLRVIHPVYGAANTGAPFVHALKLAQVSRGEIEIVDVRSEEEALEHIGVRTILERWGVLPPGAHRGDLSAIGLKVKKVVREGDKRKEIVRRLDKHVHDLLVVGIEKKSALTNLFARNLAEYLAQYFAQATLFIPSGARSFVNERTGELSLNTILLPLADSSFFEASMKSLQHFLSFLPQNNKPTVVGLHSGVGFPKIKRPAAECITWLETVRSEPVVDAIVHAAEIYNADLIIMTTRGRCKFSQWVTGSITEQAVRFSPCPVMSVPILQELQE